MARSITDEEMTETRDSLIGHLRIECSRLLRMTDARFEKECGSVLLDWNKPAKSQEDIRTLLKSIGENAELTYDVAGYGA
ncbi:MAG: hypothetical protein WCP10_15130 [Desulfuromonadales bacterium]